MLNCIAGQTKFSKCAKWQYQPWSSK